MPLSKDVYGFRIYLLIHSANVTLFIHPQAHSPLIVMDNVNLHPHRAMIVSDNIHTLTLRAMIFRGDIHSESYEL